MAHGSNSITVPSHKPSSSTPVDDAHKFVKTGTEFSLSSNPSSVPDIEHVPVENDPRAWSPFRKLVYILSLGIFTLGNIIVALSRRVELVIGFRCLQAAGSSAVLSIGAATLADIFDPKERVKKMGIYYMAPLLGPALGPIFGGVLTSTFNWRATFWFLSILSGSSLLLFILFFHDTFRRQRSLTYQSVLKQRRRAGGITFLMRAK
ncbi:MFS general substrate transporter [Phlegmacium glaucopus]|nr:MFS general substrate transporter [Phlegmacium glaucopus]